MDVHDGVGSDGAQPMRQPPGHDAGTSSGDGHGPDDTAGPVSSGESDDTTGSGDTSGSAGSPSGSGGAGGAEGSTTITVEVEGETRQLPAQHDYTGDGLPDAAVETDDGKVIVFADTEDNATGEAGPDGRADEAYVVDKSTGQVVGAAHVDPATGTWIEGHRPGRAEHGGRRGLRRDQHGRRRRLRRAQRGSPAGSGGPGAVGSVVGAAAGGAPGDGGSSSSGGQQPGGVATDDDDDGATRDRAGRPTAGRARAPGRARGR